MPPALWEIHLRCASEVAAKEGFDGPEGQGRGFGFALGFAGFGDANDVAAGLALIEVVVVQEAVSQSFDQGKSDVRVGRFQSFVEEFALAGGNFGICKAVQEEEGRRGGAGPGGGIGLFYEVWNGFEGGSEEAGFVVLGAGGHSEEIGGRVGSDYGVDGCFGSGECGECGEVGSGGGSPECDAVGI